MKTKELFGLFRETAQSWSQDQVPFLAAALAYYTIFSLAPLSVLVIALVGIIWNESVARNQLIEQIQSLFGSDAAKFVGGLVTRTSVSSGSGWVTVFGAITLVLGALGVFGALRVSLNRIWNVRPIPPSDFKESLRRIVINRSISFGLVILIGFLMLVSLLVSTAVGGLDELFSQALPISEIFLECLNFVVSFVAITTLFALIFRILPDVEIAWKDTWLGATVTAILFLIGKTLLGFYLGNGNIGSSFGAAGSLVLMMLFIYYAAQIFFFGAVFTRVYAKRFGSHIVPAENAIPRIQSDIQVGKDPDVS